MLRQIRIGFALCHDALEVVIASQPEQSIAVSINVIAVKESFAALRYYSAKPELAVNQRQIPKVLTVSESAILLLIIRLGVLVPKNIEGIEQRFGTSEEQIPELRLAMRIDADDFSVNDATTPVQVAS